MSKDLKVLVAGCGSIGKRHIRNLSQLGIERFILCDKDESALKEASSGLKAPVLTTDFREALLAGPGAAVVATPSSLHLEMAASLVEKGVHVLIEKPLSHSTDGIEDFRSLVEENRVVGMMAMCYRFHPVFVRLKKLLDGNAVGRTLHVNYFGGHYLPDWHPQADYRTEYAARKELGGGVVLTSIHGLDNIRWLFGEPAECRSFVDRVSALEMDVEDIAVSLMRMTSGAYVSWQSDFLQRAPSHRMVVAGSTGTIRCDFLEGTIEVYAAGSGQWTTEKIEFDPNDMYMKEAEYFLDCVAKRIRPLMDVTEGVRTLKLASAVLQDGKSEESLCVTA